MKLESPLYRKVIIPWYDSETACLIVIIFMFIVFMFSLVGISVTNEFPEYKDHIGVPIALIIMSVLVILFTTFRLIKRYAYRFRIEE
ncbi:hypothetical protein QUF80_03450 [Desulfococcaceae bacterium HSG8]|nr:hypothetical protein [Desulfococcaceae bacterium HSG8]